MATKTMEKTRLQIRYTNEAGNIAKTFSLSRIDTQADADTLLALANAITSLQTLTAKDYKMVDTSVLEK